MIQLTENEHLKRQKNLLQATKLNNKYLRKHVIQNYLPAHVTYNLGEYPAPFSITPTEYDYKLLSQLAENGVDLIQVHEEWNDSLRVLGGDKLTTHDKEGFRKFVDLVHYFGMKIIPYFSSGYFQKTDPDFQNEWLYTESIFDYICYNYALCSPSSPSWRAYLLPKLERIMEEYGVDGLYNDLGYDRKEFIEQMNKGFNNQISPGIDTMEHDAALEDLLGSIMNMIHKYNGVCKIHYSGNKRPNTMNRVYDYIWVGECVDNIDSISKATGNFLPYVVPSVDLGHTKLNDEDELYLTSIPYMQFPLRVDGRPFTGERAMVADMPRYRAKEDDGLYKHLKVMNDYHKEHPNGPYMYGWWDSKYGREGAREKWFYYLKLYKPMVTDDSWCFINIKESGYFKGSLQEDIVASMFVNENTYMVIANYGKQAVVVPLEHLWENRETGEIAGEVKIPSRKMVFLKAHNEF